MKKMYILVSAALLFFTACGDKSGKPAEAQQPAAEVVQSVVSAQIAYVDLDSLLTNYDLYIDKNAEIQATELWEALPLTAGL